MLSKRCRSQLSFIDNKNGFLNIVEGSVSGILDKFKEQSSFGEHSILIYPDRYALREVYSRTCKLALENNEAVIILSHYETRDDVLTYLRELDIDVYRFEKKERSLLIIDSVEDYFGSPKDFLFYLNLMSSKVSKRNKRGILVLMDVGFHYRISTQTQKGINSLMEYEEILPAKPDLNVKILCLYHVKDFDTLNQVAGQKEYLLKLHYRRYRIKENHNPYDNASDDESISIQC
jgi:hypothetical protein